MMGMNGPGKYDDLATYARETAYASGVLLIVLGGEDGDGFSVQAELGVIAKIPSILRSVADEIESQITEA